MTSIDAVQAYTANHFVGPNRNRALRKMSFDERNKLFKKTFRANKLKACLPTSCNTQTAISINYTTEQTRMQVGQSVNL